MSDTAAEGIEVEGAEADTGYDPSPPRQATAARPVHAASRLARAVRRVRAGTFTAGP